MNIGIFEFSLCELSRLMEYMFSFIFFRQFCDKKKKNLCIPRDRNWKKGCVGCRWDGQKSLGRQCPFLFVCVCLWGGGWAG